MFFEKSKSYEPSKTSESYHKLTNGDNEYRISIGREGVIESLDKREGDGCTPAGLFHFTAIYYRLDKLGEEEIKKIKEIGITLDIPVIHITTGDIWCDDPKSSQYNQHIRLPFEYNPESRQLVRSSFNYSHEELWRDNSDVYDIVLPLNYNLEQTVDKNGKGMGSAIFTHLEKNNYAATSGCLGLNKKDLLEFLSQLSKDDEIKIDLSGNCEVIKAPTEEFKFN